MTSRPPPRLAAARRRAVPPRRPRNGHHADCPYPTQNAATCPICAGIRKAADQEKR